MLLQAVIEHGSFSRAAEMYNRSQSSLSYQLTLMQERLGVPLLTIVGRKAELTPEGQQLLAQVQPLLQGFRTLENRAEALKRGERARLDLVVDSIFPKSHLFDVLRRFQQAFPMTQVHLTEVLRSESLSELKQRHADVYLITPTHDVATRGRLLMEITFAAVAHRNHPLLQLPAPLSRDDLARYPPDRNCRSLTAANEQPPVHGGRKLDFHHDRSGHRSRRAWCRLWVATRRKNCTAISFR